MSPKQAAVRAVLLLLAVQVALSCVAAANITVSASKSTTGSSIAQSTFDAAAVSSSGSSGSSSSSSGSTSGGGSSSSSSSTGADAPPDDDSAPPAAWVQAFFVINCIWLGILTVACCVIGCGGGGEAYVCGDMLLLACLSGVSTVHLHGSNDTDAAVQAVFFAFPALGAAGGLFVGCAMVVSHCLQSDDRFQALV